jgi:hypothetical protein
MNFLLFVLEILFIVTVIALVPARPELRLRRASKPCGHNVPPHNRNCAQNKTSKKASKIFP